MAKQPTSPPPQQPRIDPSAEREPCVLTVNGGSSSIKFAVFSLADPPRRVIGGSIERIGLDGSTITTADADGESIDRSPIDASDHREAAGRVIDWFHQRVGSRDLAAVGHRVVHGGTHLVDHQIVTPQLVAELKRNEPLDLAHLPREIALIEAFREKLPGRPQVACFDTAFHRHLPRVAQLLPIPRKYLDQGVRRFGFHGVSYAYLMSELRRVAGDDAADGRVILAHLGSGASMAAVHRGKPIDTTMAFTPTAGLVMGTRPGDIDPGLLVYLARSENLTPEQMDDLVSKRCGLVGVSGGVSDMRDLSARRATDRNAADAVELFCYQARKFIGALAAAMGGIDQLVFAGGIGEHAPDVRAEICRELGFLGIALDPSRNDRNDAVISADASRVPVRVIRTDEEVMIASAVQRLLSDDRRT